jgi:4-coumarate--CoA ligase
MLSASTFVVRRARLIGGVRTYLSTSTRGFASSVEKAGNLADVCELNIVQSPFPPIDPSLLHSAAAVPEFVSSDWKSPTLANKVAVRDGSTGESRTFSDYHTSMTNVASALHYEYMLKPEESVALFSPNNIDYLPICLAVGMCGSKVAPINPLSTADELSKILERSSSKILFTHAKLLTTALDAASKCDCVEHVVVIPDVQSDPEIAHGTVNFESLSKYIHSSPLTESVEAVHQHVKDVHNHPWLLPYSSGTTGLPKGVCLSHGNMISNLLQMDLIDGPAIPQDHKLYSPLPFFHIYGFLLSVLYSAWKGNELITTSGRFDLETFCSLVQEHKPERAHLVPPIILGLGKHPVVDNYDLSSIKMIITAAAPLGLETEAITKKRLGTNIKQAWGMSELSPLGTMNSDFNVKTGSVGPLVPSTYGKILDVDTGKSLGPNESGELVIKGPQVMMGYLNDTEKTEECLSDKGWLRTGDLAYYDEDGFFYLTDRIKELIKVRGFQVAPAELEELILNNEHVQDVAVVQIPDEVSGELPRAYVVLKPSADPNEVTEQYLKDWVKERVSPYKRIEGGVVFVDAIPKSASGKILRRLLRDQVKKEFA